MRILAIRGCNLASLAGEFEIDLSRAPFSEAGVFAIVGNTGAGKSTLLDALCVALFDRTPRLTNHSRVVVGRGEDDPGALGAQDVRTLLRRGAAAGYAEVDFEAGDMRRYRARWSVRRARNQTDGTLQDQQITLSAIDGGERFGGTKTETLRAITARLGLTFDQFRRSALLAQGEFAAFLRADGKDRSELLERMTGTEIYSRLSVAAHVKAALAEQTLRDGHARADAIPFLDDEARAAASRDLVLAEEAKQAARAALAEVEAFARWRAEASRLHAALAEAERDHAAAVAALAAAEPERAELALRRRAEQLRGVWEDHARADRAVALAQAEVEAVERAVASARATYEALLARRTSLTTLHEPVRAARIAAGLVERAPQVFASGHLDTRAVDVAMFDCGVVELVGEAARGDGLQRARALETRAVDPAMFDGRAVEAVPPVAGDADMRGIRAHIFDVGLFDSRVVEDALQVAANDAGWLVTHASLAPEVAAWPDLDMRFAQHGTLADATASIDRTVRDHAQTRNKLVKARDVVAAEHAAANAKLAEAQRKSTNHVQRRGITLDAARRQEDDARTRLVEVERLVSIAASARDALHVRQNIDQQLAELGEHAATDTEHRARVLADRAAALVARGERARIVEELRRAAGYEHARAELRDGEPCPLCGAEDHPWKTRGAFDDVIRSEETHLAEVSAQLELLGNALAQLAAREQQRARDLQRLTRSRETALASAATDVPRWREQLTVLGELLLETDPSTADAERIANELEAAATARLEQARATFGQAQAAAKAAREAQAEVQLVQANVEQIQLQLADHDRRIAELDATVQRLAGERTSRTERASELDSELTAAMARWRVALDDAPRSSPSSSQPPLSTELVASTSSPAVAKPRREATQASTRTSRSNRRLAGTGVREDDLRAAIVRAAEAPLSIIDARDLVAARGAMSEVAAAWRTRADRVSSADAAATGALAAIEGATREAERAVTEHTARHEAAVQRRNALVDELREASERLADALAGVREPVLVDDPSGRRATDRDAEVLHRIAAGSIDEGRTDVARADDEHRRNHVAVDERHDAPRVDLDLDNLRRLLAAPPARIDELAMHIDMHERTVDRTRAIVVERRARCEAHVAARPPATRFGTSFGVRVELPFASPSASRLGTAVIDMPLVIDDTDVVFDSNELVANDGANNKLDEAAIDELDDAAVDECLRRLGAQVRDAEQRAAQLTATIAADDDARMRREAAMAMLVEIERAAEMDRVLGEVIGSHDGKLFRSFAQSLTLDGLLAVANAHLEELVPRYQLERVPRHDLELQVIDRDLGAEVRSVQSLSGGESFLVSLALALGLSSMSAHDVRVRTLLIDEGFGTLDPATLDSALSVLDALQATGRQVGVISHVPALVERVGAHVRVIQRGGGRSEVIVA